MCDAQSPKWQWAQALAKSFGVWASASVAVYIIYGIPLTHATGQVSGVAISSAVFQSILGHELQTRIHGPNAAEVG